MIVDLDEYFHPILSIADAVVGMEGNGPTAGTPRAIGCLLASHSPHNLDMIAAKILGFERAELPILESAYRRGMTYATAEEVNLIGDVNPLILSDFERVIERHSLQFSGDGKSGIKRAFSSFASSVLSTKPKLSPSMCVGCGICRDICPAKAIEIKNKKAKIDRRACIRCFCCQEFCPKSAMKVYRTPIAKLFHSEKK
jgi:ferredoxin